MLGECFEINAASVESYQETKMQPKKVFAVSQVPLATAVVVVIGLHLLTHACTRIFVHQSFAAMPLLVHDTECARCGVNCLVPKSFLGYSLSWTELRFFP